MPKILWLKKQMTAERFEDLQFFDLPDYRAFVHPLEPSRNMHSCSHATPHIAHLPPAFVATTLTHAT